MARAPWRPSLPRVSRQVKCDFNSICFLFFLFSFRGVKWIAKGQVNTRFVLFSLSLAAQAGWKRAVLGDRSQIRFCFREAENSLRIERKSRKRIERTIREEQRQGERRDRDRDRDRDSDRDRQRVVEGRPRKTERKGKERKE